MPLSNKLDSLVRCSIAGYRQILQADASVVDLNKLGPYYYDLGRKLCDLEVMRERDEIQRALIEAYGTRFRTIMDASQNIMRVGNCGFANFSNGFAKFGVDSHLVLYFPLNVQQEDSSKWTKRLDIAEKKLFAKGQKVDSCNVSVCSLSLFHCCFFLILFHILILSQLHAPHPSIREQVTQQLNDWEKRESQKIVASQTVINHKKRRIAEGKNIS